MIVKASIFKIETDSGQEINLGDAFNNTVFGLTLGFGLLTFLYGCCGTGCFLSQFTDIRWPMCFGCSLFFVWVFYIIVATLALVESYAAESQIEALCDYRQ